MEPVAKHVLNHSDPSDPGAVLIMCPGCGQEHPFDLKRWNWNGDVVRPTFTPSLKVTTGPFPEGTKRAGRTDVCHSIVTDGTAAFCGDCTHENAGKSIPLPPYEATRKNYDSAMYLRLGMADPDDEPKTP